VEPKSEHVAWMEQWRGAARARAMGEAVLSLAAPRPPAHPRHSWSGLVEQQALCRRLRR
jgi:hypothetical protein